MVISLPTNKCTFTGGQMQKSEFPGGAKDVTGWAIADPVYDLKKALVQTAIKKKY